MTPEPISDEIAVLAAVITAGIPKAISRLDAAQFERRADSLIRGFVYSLKSKLSPPIPPNVQAAMERHRNHTENANDLQTIATWATSHLGKDRT